MAATDDGAAGVAAPVQGAGFTVMISGQLESGRALGYDALSAEFFFEAGPDWTRVDGVATSTTQSAFRGGGGASREAVWGMPLEVSYRTTNAYGWPRLGVAVSGVDSLGRGVIVGYGSTLVPLSGSGHTRRIRLFAPVSSTVIQQFFAWATANPPRFWKKNIVTQGIGREVTRVTSAGTVTVTLNVVTRGMTRHGYNAGTEPDSLPAEFVAAGMSTAPGLPGSIAGAAAAAGAGPAGGRGAPTPIGRSSSTTLRALGAGAARTASWRRGASGRGVATPPSTGGGSDAGADAAGAEEAEAAAAAGAFDPAAKAPAPADAPAPSSTPAPAPAPAGDTGPAPAPAVYGYGARRPAADAPRTSARRGSDASAGSAGSRRSRGGSALDRFSAGGAPRRAAMGYGSRSGAGAAGSDSMDL